VKKRRGNSLDIHRGKGGCGKELEVVTKAFDNKRRTGQHFAKSRLQRGKRKGEPLQNLDSGEIAATQLNEKQGKGGNFCNIRKRIGKRW